MPVVRVMLLVALLPDAQLSEGSHGRLFLFLRRPSCSSIILSPITGRHLHKYSLSSYFESFSDPMASLRAQLGPSYGSADFCESYYCRPTFCCYPLPPASLTHQLVSLAFRFVQISPSLVCSP